MVTVLCYYFLCSAFRTKTGAKFAPDLWYWSICGHVIYTDYGNLLHMLSPTRHCFELLLTMHTLTQWQVLVVMGGKYLFVNCEFGHFNL